ncbi:glycosyltransferase [Pseudomonas sp. RD9SR1]|uniref:Glycosyltransferase n=1 Tax=Pseudomonas oryzicola TaxID=485876 RepID=A0ABS6QGS1_9PSED|nr:glycosyltransferase [Pseudomonas oryzicola]MBV4493371.1 glycosyltransferase [Pseudomonas oryzicola]
MNCKPRVAVLLAAYNGVDWLQEQVESILLQEGVNVTIYASVDRSEDGTEEWLRAYQEHCPALCVLPVGVFGGAAKNFFRLLRDVDTSKYDYVALADQDDIWCSEKLLSAHQVISSGVADAYSANVTAFWPDGRKKLIDKAGTQKKYDYYFEAAGPGCTYVLRCDVAQGFKQFLIEHWQSASAVALHDWLIYAWVRSVGRAWYIDQRSMLNYRQHASNQMGANTGIKQLWRRVRLVQCGWYRGEVEKIAQLLALGNGQSAGIHPDLSNRLFLIKNFSQTRRNARDRLFLLALLLFNIY